jgi:hypothetical protein
MKRLNIKHLQTINWKGFTTGKKVLFTSLFLAIIIFVLLIIFLSFPQTYLNGFLKNKIIYEFTKAYPEYSLKIADVNFNFLKNRIECDSIEIAKPDSTYSCQITSISLSGVGWIELFRGSKFSNNSIANASLDVEGIVFDLKQLQYQIQCGRMHFSVADSIFTAGLFKFHPLVSDEKIFKESKFRNTRYRLIIPKININGLAYLDLINKNNYEMRSINIQDAFLDVLVNMDKPSDTKAPNPLMPSAGLSSMMDTIHVDSLQVMGSRLDYYERYVIGEKAATVTFDNIQALVEGIANHTGIRDTIAIHAQGNFMNTSVMKLIMSIPLGSPDFSFSYSGSLRKMEVNSLNKFLVIAEHHRIKSGILQSANFNINVNSGHATGYVRAEYNDLSVAVLNKETGSENGVFNKMSSLFAKTFIIRGNNMPDKTGLMKIGVVKYTRKPDETFTQFVWYALRSGVGNVVGF